MKANLTEFKKAVDREIIQKMFDKFSKVYAQTWKSRCTTKQDWEEYENIWLEFLGCFDQTTLRKAAVTAFSLYVDFPPTPLQIRNLCLKESGVPTPSEVMELMIRREFTHPIVKFCYDKVGSWTVSHAKKEELVEKIASIYTDALLNFTQDTKSAWIQLADFKATKAIPVAEISKIPSQKERKSFSENLKHWQAKAAAEKAALPTIEHPVWDKTKINPSHDNFCAKTYNERKRYLISVEEHLSTTLSHEDWYDRTRYFKEIEANTMISRNRAANPAEPEKSSSRPSSYVKPAYRSWVN